MPVLCDTRTEYSVNLACDKCGYVFPGHVSFSMGVSRTNAISRAINYGAKEKNGKFYCASCFSELEKDHA